jgi:hypothetical protein
MKNEKLQPKAAAAMRYLLMTALLDLGALFL